MKSARSVLAVLALLVLTLSVIQIPAQAQIRPLKINNAIYGHNGKGMNVTNLLRSMVQNNTLDVKVNNKNMGGDPNVGADKSLKVDYTYQGRTSTKVVKEANSIERMLTYGMSGPGSCLRNIGDRVLLALCPRRWLGRY
jgi:hypothetical protein